ncbi:hypothetical protein [Paenibacillus sp. TC-CSREp1]|uniref:hypothetical protein n=1 Tax=Paenibacillus sp. TC-CSREp1 TaxID=3410089 RepID=UPI003CE6B2F4
MRIIGALIAGLITQQFAFHIFDASPAEGFLAYVVGIVLAKQIISEVSADEQRSQNG